MDNPLRILVAEDDDSDVLLLRRALSNAKLDQPVFIARDGQEVMEYLQGSPPFNNPEKYPLPNMLLLDLNMPRLDGFQVLEWLQHQRELSRLVVIVFSSSAESEDLRRACALGANFYIVKPHDIKELEHIMERARDYWREVTRTPGVQPGALPVDAPLRLPA
jgi:CheY-like chemotaxis protein